MPHSQFFSTYIMEVRPRGGSGSFRPEDKQSAEHGQPEAIHGGRRHRAPGLLDGLRERVATALGRRGSSTAVKSDTAQAAPDSAAAETPYEKEVSAYLDEVNSICERLYAMPAFSIGGAALASRKELFNALKNDCEIVIILERGRTEAPHALLRSIIDLVDALGRGTNARFVFKVEVPADRERLEALCDAHHWAMVDGRRRNVPTFADFTENERWFPAI
jgi:hypothetical protein